MTIKTILSHLPRISLARFSFGWWRHKWLLMTSQSPDDCDAITWIMISNSSRPVVQENKTCLVGLLVRSSFRWKNCTCTEARVQFFTRTIARISRPTNIFYYKMSGVSYKATNGVNSHALIIKLAYSACQHHCNQDSNTFDIMSIFIT